ncbi:hypothetical protein QBC44DRAFT_387307 [Cladorrhinum sp. PSN332]|nr:hypothetical protein QBC44DRAFT_387307 [Cladorrhinum sp. PSN332]
MTDNITALRSSGDRLESDWGALAVIGRQIDNKQLLHSLCLASRLFNSEFTRYLYRKIERLDGISPANPHLRHTKILIPSDADSDDAGEGLNYKTREILYRMPLLDTFVWADGRMLETETIEVLRASCPRVKDLRLNRCPLTEDHITDWLLDEEPGWFSVFENAMKPYRLHLSAFHNLTYLALHDIYDDLYHDRRQISRVLCQSPKLRGLELSLSRRDVIGRMISQSEGQCFGFFDQLCLDYAGGGGQPLQLKTLKLGHSIYALDESSLQRLTELTYLEEVHIHTTGILFNDLEWFHPANCPNLRLLSAARYWGGMLGLLCKFAKHKSHSRKLALSFPPLRGDALLSSRNVDAGPLLRRREEFPGLPMQMRMLDLSLDRNKIYLNGFGTRESDLQFASQVLEDLVASNGNSLEGLTLRLPAKNKKGGMGGGYNNITEQDLVSAVSGLSKLTQLCLDGAGSWRLDDTTMMAEQVAVACPTLKYLRNEWECWKILRDEEGGVELEELTRDEWEKVELFSFTIMRP